jgi:hypothetical protein
MPLLPALSIQYKLTLVNDMYKWLVGFYNWLSGEASYFLPHFCTAITIPILPAVHGELHWGSGMAR